MNQSGELNLTRFEIYLTELAKFDHQRYVNENDTFKHLDKLIENGNNLSKKKSIVLKDGDGVDSFDLAVLDKLTITTTNVIEQNEDTDKKNSNRAVPIELKPGESTLLSDSDNFLSDSDSISCHSNDEEKNSSSTSKINEDDLDSMSLIEAEFRQHKNHYYRNKMNINLTSSDQLQTFVKQYIEALQWILKYYYQGCPSWSWFYPHHYAPYLSDLKNFKDLKITLKQGTPFKPFEQLLSMSFQF